MSIDPISLTAASVQQVTKGQTPDVRASAESLGDTFNQMFQEVNSLQNESTRKMEEFATSPEKDVHGTMIAMQKADVSMRLLLQIRSKLTSAYQEIMRMQI